MSKFAELQNQHKVLLDSIERNEKNTEAILAYIHEVIQSSSYISTTRERDQLRAILRYWASYTFDRTGKYPNTQLLPVLEIEKNRGYSKWIIWRRLTRLLAITSTSILLLIIFFILFSLPILSPFPAFYSPTVTAMLTPTAILPKNIVECGQIIEGEFTKTQEENIYTIEMEPRESFSVSSEPIGDSLKIGIGLYGPSGIRLSSTGNTLLSNPEIESGILGARGNYEIRVANTGIYTDGTFSTNIGGVGAYTLFIDCAKADGTRIEPGDIPQPTPTPALLPTATLRSVLSVRSSTFTGTGFPGLTSVDFADAVTVPLLLDQVMTGVIPTGSQILGFTLDAAAGDTLDSATPASPAT